MSYLAKEINMWPTTKSGFNTIDEAIKWAESNLNGKWAIWEDVYIPRDPVYKNH